MADSSLSTNLIVLAILLVCSGFFSMAETAMMASNRHRLRVAAKQGNRGAKLGLHLLNNTDKLLGVILLGNTLINAAAATLTGYVALAVFGQEKWALEVGTLFVTFCLLVFSEITPKVIGATHPDWITHRIGFILTPLLKITYPIIWFVNLWVSALLRIMHLHGKPGHGETSMAPDELRAMILESGQFIPQEHRAILVNLFDLESITAEDIMTPRGEIEAIDLNDDITEIRQQLATSFHSRIPVYDTEPGNIVGILQQRRLLGASFGETLSPESIREVLTEPYFIPASTPVYEQLQYFKENRQRFGLVVDEYGELLGLVTLEDIIEELIGKFTTSTPGGDTAAHWDENGSVMVDGARTLRSLNRELTLELPLEGPKTLNGLILEHLQDIPEAGVSVRIAGVPMEIVQTHDRRIKVVKLQRPLVIKANDMTQ